MAMHGDPQAAQCYREWRRCTKVQIWRTAWWIYTVIIHVRARGVTKIHVNQRSKPTQQDCNWKLLGRSEARETHERITRATLVLLRGLG